MTRKPRPPIGDPPRNLRQRQRANGTWRIWWEPRPQDRLLGFAPVDLDATRTSWSVAEAARLNAEADRAIKAGGRTTDAARSRTVEDLIRLYRASVHYRETLRPKTRASYDKLLSSIEAKWGPRKVADFDKAVMSTWYETLYYGQGPRMAQALIRMMSILFAFAETKVWRPENSNPCTRLKIKTPAPRSRTATWAEVDAILAAAERLGLHGMALAIRISLFQGQRETDVITALRGDFGLRTLALDRQGPRPVWVWAFRRSKRLNAALLPLHPEVIPAVRAALADAGTPDTPRLPTDPLIVDEAVGRAYDEYLFNKRWRRIRAEAAAGAGLAQIATLQFRDLRRTFGVMSRAGGATKDDTGDVLGNSAANDPVLGETYMPATFKTASRAIAAVQRPQVTDKRK